MDITTIDSLAARIVSDLDDGLTRFRSFDDTVRCAIDILVSVGWKLDPVAHVVVDEVQDVVGLRAQFVLQLLDVLVAGGSGFTLLGDPLQAIYDFQIGREGLTCLDFLQQVRERFQPGEHILTGEYRSRSDQTRAAAISRNSLAGLNSDHRLQRLEAIAVDIPPLGLMDANAVADLGSWHGTTALLCDTNIRAALAAQRATELGLLVTTAPNRDDSSFPAWIAVLLQDHPEPTLTRAQFFELQEAEAATDAGDRWRLLMHVSRSRRELSLRDLGVGLHSRVRAVSPKPSPNKQMVSSTVHRAKGLEFDNVVLVDSDRWTWHDQETIDAASRRLFVALTRARSRLCRVRGIDTRGWSRQVDHDIPTWVKREPRQGRRGRATAVLLEPWMARSLGPALVNLAGFVGSPVAWVRTEELITVDGDVIPSWVADVNGTPIARTGEAFGQTIANLTDSTLTRLPHLIGGYIEGLETITGPASPDGPGRHGFWVGARVSGTVIFEKEREERHDRP